ncbi:MAG: hypothetical protein GQE15_27500 [Archangiaceae bacterium]|nr:hypothetical protein [Archangiaceae bacterium]
MLTIDANFKRSTTVAHHTSPGKSSQIDYRRVAFFKAMALASFDNPLRMHGLLTTEQEQQIGRHAAEAASLDDPRPFDVRDCLVCGVKSLALIANYDCDLADDESEVRSWWSVFLAKCSCCGFEITDELGNPTEYGLPVPDLWVGTSRG